MSIDPVILLVEELRTTEVTLSKAVQGCKRNDRQEDSELLPLLQTIIDIGAQLYRTIPTSALGAAEFLKMAVPLLPPTTTGYAARLQQIADRLSTGKRVHTDLIWLRALKAVLLEGLLGTDGYAIVPLLSLAITGASRPVMVFRAVQAEPAALPRKAFSQELRS